MGIQSKFDKDSIFQAPLPFRVKVSFKEMFDYWEKLADGEDKHEAQHARDVLDRLSHARELHEPFDDFSLVDKYAEEIALLFSPIFPEPTKENEIKAISLPFRHYFFNETPRFRKILDQTDNDFLLSIRDLNPEDMYIFSCLFLLNVLHGVNIQFKRPFYFDIPQKDGVVKHYRAFFNGDFASFTPNERAKELSEADIQRLVDNFQDVELWKEMIPPESFDFEGFGIVTLFDVTTDEALSAMKNILLKPDALRSADLLNELEKNMRSYFDLEDIHLGFATYEAGARKIKRLNSNSVADIVIPEGDCDDVVLDAKECFCDVSLKEIFGKKNMFVLSNLEKVESIDSPLFDRMLAQDVKSLIVCPLEYDEEIIGFLELTSPKPYQLNSVMANKLKDVIPLYTIAMKRARDERETKLEAIVQEKFTSIHSSVSWRFTEVAERILRNRELKQPDEIDDVVFRDVVPLYGQFDIRGSSSARNEAIQADLVRQLQHAEFVMEEAMRHVDLPIYDQLKYRIVKYRTNLEQNVSAGDEVKVLDFLQSEIYPVFSHLKQQDTGITDAIASYEKELDTDLSVIYDKRKNYEDSVMMINETISAIVDEEQEKAQQMFPHYFEKYKTDGVEYNAYIGQSLMQNLTYDPLYLKNLRLWQLLLTYKVEHKLHSIRERLPVPLEIASLVLAHNAPLSIKFRLDEKKFDVDGAYNIRYEIVKKRIDKANVKGTTERLTQPGKIAVVYSQDEEAEEYIRYFDYLHRLKMITGDVENLELQDLQGTSGLRALRADILYPEEYSDSDKLEEAIQQVKQPA